MKLTLKSAAAALLTLGSVAVATSSASAAVVCNNEGACWHARRPYAYRPEYGVVVHPDNWRWGAGDHYAWREHAGRGYWRGGAWVPF